MRSLTDTAYSSSRPAWMVPLALFVKAYQELGPIFRVRVPGREYTVLAGPESTLFLAQGDEAYVSSREAFSKVMQELKTENFIAALEGEAHHHQRKILKPGLSREAINRYIPPPWLWRNVPRHAWLSWWLWCLISQPNAIQ